MDFRSPFHLTFWYFSFFLIDIIYLERFTPIKFLKYENKKIKLKGLSFFLIRAINLRLGSRGTTADASGGRRGNAVEHEMKVSKYLHDSCTCIIDQA